MTQERRKDDRHPDRPLDWSDTEASAGQALAAPQADAGKEVPEGWKLVPVEPTMEMIAAIAFKGDVELAIGHAAISESVAADYAAMLAAAPAAPVAAPQPQWFDSAMDTGVIPARASLSSPAERHEAEEQSPSFDSSMDTGIVPASAETVYDDYCPEPRLAAPSSPSVSGTVASREFMALLKAHREAYQAAVDGFDPSDESEVDLNVRAAWDALIAHIDQHTAQAVRAAREEARNDALDEAVNTCDAKYQARAGSGYAREASTARALSKEINALRTPQAAGTEQEKKQ